MTAQSLLIPIQLDALVVVECAEDRRRCAPGDAEELTDARLCERGDHCIGRARRPLLDRRLGTGSRSLGP